MTVQFKNDAEMEAFAKKLVDAAESTHQFMEIVCFGRESLAKDPALFSLLMNLWSAKKDWPVWQLTADVMEKCSLRLVAESEGGA